MIYNLNKLCIQSHLLQILNSRGTNLDKPLFSLIFNLPWNWTPIMSPTQSLCNFSWTETYHQWRLVHTMRFFPECDCDFLSRTMGCVDVEDAVQVVRLQWICVCDVAHE